MPRGRLNADPSSRQGRRTIGDWWTVIVPLLLLVAVAGFGAVSLVNARKMDTMRPGSGSITASSASPIHRSAPPTVTAEGPFPTRARGATRTVRPSETPSPRPTAVEARPHIVRFDARRIESIGPSIAKNRAQARVTWEVHGATTVRVQGHRVAPRGTVIVQLGRRVTLVATNPGGTVRRSIIVLFHTPHAEAIATRGPPPAATATRSPLPTPTALPRSRATATPRPRATATATPRPRATATTTPRPRATTTPRPRATTTPRPRATTTPRPRATATPRPTTMPTHVPSATATARPPIATATVPSSSTPPPTASPAVHPLPLPSPIVTAVPTIVIP